MPAYLIADVNVTDDARYDDYKQKVAPQIAKYGGRFLSRAGAHAVLEGAWQPHRLVLIEFPDMAALQAWYRSPEYAPLIALRKTASSGNLVALEGS